jgi:hypothetical protein
MPHVHDAEDKKNTHAGHNHSGHSHSGHSHGAGATD